MAGGREAARRILRTRKVVMDVNENDMDTAHRLVSAISDANPAQLTLPEVRAAHTTRIWNAEAEFPLVAWDSSDDVRTLLFQSEGALSVIFMTLQPWRSHCLRRDIRVA